MQNSTPSSLPLALGILGIVGTLLGVILGAALNQIWTGMRESRARRYRFVERQVDDLYAPLVGLRKDIRAKSELREKVGRQADIAWPELCRGKSPEALLTLQKKRFPAFEALVKYDNKQLTEELLPDYRRMLEIFKANYALAEESTRNHYDEFVEFIEIWNRSQAGSLPYEVFMRLEHGEVKLHPFYADIEARLDELRTKLTKGRA